MKFFDLELNGLSVEMINLNSSGSLSKASSKKPAPFFNHTTRCIQYFKENCNKDAL